MCGINGIISRAAISGLSEKIGKMNDAIYHRGPDSEGVYVKNDRVAMGMRRLSIIDLVSGDQPIFNSDRTIAIVFNGEIYNFKELKNDLYKRGVSFSTNTDTEVILKLYELYGEKALTLLNGAFAFSIHDLKRNKVFIARDRFGKKPVYYYKDDNFFIWASELKSILKCDNINRELSVIAINQYFTFSFIPAPYTIYKNIFKIDPAHCFEVDCSSLEVTDNCYWKMNYESPVITAGYEASKEQLKKLLYDSVEKRMISDVPIGTFLSGGVDSSIVTAIMADISDTQIQTFSIGYEDKRYDESERAGLVSKHCKTNHHLYLLKPEELIDDIDKIITNFDEPFGDSSSLPTYCVSKIARKNVTVVLTGDGGDEAFGGYNRYTMGHYRNIYNKIIPGFIHKNLVKKAVSGISSQDEDTKSKMYKVRKFINSVSENDFLSIYNLMSLGFHDPERINLIKENYYSDDVLSGVEKIYKHVENNSYLKKARYIDQILSLEGDMLVKVDRTSMLNSLECRSPFLDYRIFEFTNTLPDSFLLNGNNKKRILKDTFAPMLPLNLFNAPKSGFEVPVGKWLKAELLPEFKKLTDKSFIENQGILNHDYLTNLLTEHLLGKKDNSSKLWLIYCFEKWYINANS